MCLAASGTLADLKGIYWHLCIVDGYLHSFSVVNIMLPHNKCISQSHKILF